MPRPLKKGQRHHPAEDDDARQESCVSDQADLDHPGRGRLAERAGHAKSTELFGIDSPSMGPAGHMHEGHPMAQMTHVAFLDESGSWTEFLREVCKLPARGAYFISLGVKVVDISGGLSRAIAIKPQGPGIGRPS